jgi:hypothetical protein
MLRAVTCRNIARRAVHPWMFASLLQAEPFDAISALYSVVIARCRVSEARSHQRQVDSCARTTKDTELICGK